MAYSFATTPSLQSLTTTAPVSAPSFSVACFFRLNDITTNYTPILLYNTSDATQSLSMAMYGAINDRVNCVSSSGGNYADVTNAATKLYSANTWHHAAIAFSTVSGSARRAYLDGANGSIGGNSFTPTGINALRIGAINGSLCEVGVWTAILTADEIASLADGMTCDKVRPQSLVFYAPLCRDLIDVKGGLTITNNNTATVAAHPRVYA